MNKIEKEYKFLEKLEYQIEKAKNIEYCPNCYSKINYKINSDSIKPFCNKCNWEGNWDEVLDEYEHKNKQRAKLIDKMLNDKNDI